MAKLKVALSLAFTVYSGICPFWLQNPSNSPCVLYTDTVKWKWELCELYMPAVGYETS